MSKKNYIRETNIAASKRRQKHEDLELLTGDRSKRMFVFNFKILCLICGELASEDVEKKKRIKYKRKKEEISNSLLHFLCEVIMKNRRGKVI